jgi:hypothetical protein
VVGPVVGPIVGPVVGPVVGRVELVGLVGLVVGPVGLVVDPVVDHVGLAVVWPAVCHVRRVICAGGARVR